MRRARACAGFFLPLVLLGACASLPQSEALLRADASAMPRRAQIVSVPFYAQSESQCGPAALAMVLGAAGAAPTPDRLSEELYIPARQGSLQVEMLAAARRHGRLAYALEPELKDVLAEIAAGHPVIVLLNQGLFAFAPYWHYAVALGYDLDRGRISLHSGSVSNLSLPLSLFEFMWKDGGRWSMLALLPGQIPASGSETKLALAVAALEQTGHAAEAQTSYAALLQRWPDNYIALMGSGTSAYALGDLAAAERAFRRTLRAHPQSGAAYNNLAQVLADRSEWDEALQDARTALQLGGPSRAAAEATLQSILQARDRARAPR